MGTFDYIFTGISIGVTLAALYNLWNIANKRRDESIQDFLDNKEKRKQEFFK